MCRTVRTHATAGGQQIAIQFHRVHLTNALQQAAGQNALARADLNLMLTGLWFDMRNDALDHAQVVQKVLAEPFPGTVAQGVSLPKVREMNTLSFGQNRRPTQIRVLGMRGRKEWVASIFAAVKLGHSREFRKV